jgi:hypothetical protein
MGRAGELGGHAGLNFKRAYFSDLTSLGKARRTIDSRLPEPSGLDIVDNMGLEQTAFQDPAMFMPRLAS